MFFHQILKRYGKKVYKNLRPGLSEPEIVELSKQLEFELPEDVVFLYKTCNGFKDETRQALLLDNGIMMSLQDSIEEYKGFSYDPELRGKLPLFDSGGGDFLLIDCDKESETYGKILIYAPALEIVEPTTIYSSLINLFMVSIRAFMVGAYMYDQDCELEIDYEKLREEAKIIEPYIPYWDEDI